MDIDSLRHAKVEEKPVENYKGDYKKLRIEEPTENTSSKTREELKSMQGLMKVEHLRLSRVLETMMKKLHMQ